MSGPQFLELKSILEIPAFSFLLVTCPCRLSRDIHSATLIESIPYLSGTGDTVSYKRDIVSAPLEFTLWWVNPERSNFNTVPEQEMFRMLCVHL